MASEEMDALCKRIRDEGVVVFDTLRGRTQFEARILIVSDAVTVRENADGFLFITRNGFWKRFWRGQIGDDEVVLRHAAMADLHNPGAKKIVFFPR